MYKKDREKKAKMLNKQKSFLFSSMAINSPSSGFESIAPGSIVQALFPRGQAESEKRVSEEKGQFVVVC